MKKEKIKLSLLDRISIFLRIYPDKPEVRKYLDQVAEEEMDKQKTKGLIQVSNAIGKVR